ncbi:conserved hypothetical protein [Pseudomonas protegens Pf-5]|uniref:Uncharacterized protein n=1 Tax=Pseudomonas fluorescens (strain ATCC BAA-477 / NRRL B-23932 / Pf-5) TaxID=220664 RepID=Q4KHQ3_PSEF5|nr:conserved hypothetical protein [Pseudomonas protegens Pf-5]
MAYSPARRLLRRKPWKHRHRALVIVDGDKAEQAMDGLFPTITAHALYKHLDFDLEAGVTHLHHSPHQFDDRTCGNRMVEINAVGGHRHQRQPAETGRGDKRNLVHPGQGSAAEQGVVMIGGGREYRLGHAGHREFGTALDFLLTKGHRTTA